MEDDPGLREGITLALDVNGYELAVATTAAEGLRLLAGGRFDLIVSHYNLPDRTAAWMLQEAESRGLLAGTPVLVTTAHPAPEGVEKYEVLRKPLELSDVLRQVERIGGAAGGNAPDAEGAVIDLVLYTSRSSPASAKAARNIRKLLEALPPARVALQVMDVAENADAAERDRIVFTPTLVKRSPGARTWVLGDLTNPTVVTDIVRMLVAEVPSGRTGA